ncbi:MAG: aspartate--tRNA ligase [Acidimicrobiales bacterium]
MTTEDHDRPTSMRTGLCGRLGIDDIGKQVALCGWVARRREHGEHLAFIDLRDHSGLVQCVVDGGLDVKNEYVLRVEGVVRHRPEGTVNPKLVTGEIELGDCTVEVLSAADTPPVPIEDRVEADEALRLRYRYLDLRRSRMQRNLRLRAKVNAALRGAMERHGFCEIETPMLWSPTPEGAREFAIPSRLHHGSFYVLPQSPQLAKQLLMVGGFDRYYQIARCMRDEDTRADRTLEFSQLDLEASFVGQDDVLAVVSDAVADASEAVTGTRPEGIDRLTWNDALDRYGTDKPDLRFGMELIDLTKVFEGTSVRAFSAPVVKALVFAGGASLGRGRIDALIERAQGLGAKGLAWFKVSAADGGGSLDSPLAAHMNDEERAGLLAATAATPGDLVLVVAAEHRLACTVLGNLRVHLGGKPVWEGGHRYVWVVDFPMFEGVDDAGNPMAAHHPFTMPHREDLERLTSDPLEVRAQAYDLVLNGWELGSGSVRIHRADIQSRVFEALGISPEDAQSRFGFLLDAFRYGAPPHAGFAIGLDRLIAIFAGEESIREVIAFPKTQSGADPMTGAPKPLADSALRELGLVIPTPKI